VAKKKVVETQDGLKNVAVAVGSVLGKLAAKIGLSETVAPTAPKPAMKKSRRKKVAAKKAVTKRTSIKKVASRAKMTSK
jgi:hypothetical protein